MTPDTLCFISLALAALPGTLLLLNLRAYAPPPPTPQSQPRGGGVSLLIPARDEERNIEATLRAALASPGPSLEVLVLDDHSSDRTAEIVRGIASRDTRARLEQAPPLPRGWCGKQHACHVLASRARYPTLVFLDADVRLSPDALERIEAFLDQSRAALVSGVPRQEVGTLSERLLIPLIHFILLGFLPMRSMRRSRLPSLSAGCGQLIAVRRDAYFAAGGHAAIRSSLHDGLHLPRLFRRHGFATDLFDATGIATCRMYRTNSEVWPGLSKNATEGLGSPPLILPMTALLLGGQVLPWLLLGGVGGPLSTGAGMAALLALLLGMLPRVAAARRFRQPWLSCLLHPVGIAALVAIQWWGLARSLAGRPAAWKGRSYATASPTASPAARLTAPGGGFQKS